MYGELVPVGGGDPIPLLKKNLLIGRRESCDIVLRFSNVSAHHCQLTVNGGYWFVKDMESRNGIKVNGVRVTEKRLTPGDELTVAKHRYEVQYSPMELGAVGPPPDDDVTEDIMRRSLLERAGLVSKSGKRSELPPDDEPRRFDVTDDSPGQIKDPNRPL
jgi:pSer/pThr/pTyr-binding forkhead associated (FHA) protein